MHQFARLVGSVVLCWSPLTSHVHGVYFSMGETQAVNYWAPLVGGDVLLIFMFKLFCTECLSAPLSRFLTRIYGA